MSAALKLLFLQSVEQVFGLHQRVDLLLREVLSPLEGLRLTCKCRNFVLVPYLLQKFLPLLFILLMVVDQSGFHLRGLTALVVPSQF